MMSLKIKPPKPKTKRRGARLYFEDGSGGTAVLISGHPSGKRCVIEYYNDRCWFPNITTSNCGTFALAIGIAKTRKGWLPTQYVFEGAGFFGERVGFRQTETEPWILWCPKEPKKLYISLYQVSFENYALAASAITMEMDQGLADFLGLPDVHLCDGDKIAEIELSPRFAALRKFKFRWDEPDQSIGTGRRGENKYRHEYTNYDEMLKLGPGGMLWPEQYETVRKGVDAIVASNLRKEVA